MKASSPDASLILFPGRFINVGMLSYAAASTEFGIACLGRSPDPPSVSTDYFSDYMSSFSGTSVHGYEGINETDIE